MPSIATRMGRVYIAIFHDIAHGSLSSLRLSRPACELFASTSLRNAGLEFIQFSFTLAFDVMKKSRSQLNTEKLASQTLVHRNVDCVTTETYNYNQFMGMLYYSLNKSIT